MFERITIRRRSSASLGQPVDVGSLAEALLFYSDVRVIANHAVLEALLTVAGTDVIVELLENEFLKLAYEADDVAIMTANTGTSAEHHNPIFYSGPRLELQELLPKLLEKTTGKTGKARRIAQRLSRKIEVIRHSGQLTEDALHDLSNKSYVQDSVSALMRLYVPEYSGSTQFISEQREKKLFVSTDIDFNLANRAYHTRIPASHSSLSPAYLLAHLMSVKADLYFAAKYNSEMAIDDVNALVVRTNIEKLLAKYEASKSSINAFQEFVFEDSKAIAEAVRTGTVSLADVLRILPQANKFKQWLQTEKAQTDVVKAYFREAITPTWIDKLPTKTVRWFLFTSAGVVIDSLGAGGLGTLGGITLGATDTFVLDRVIKGWKPTQFVNDALVPLLRKPDGTNQ